MVSPDVDPQYNSHQQNINTNFTPLFSADLNISTLYIPAITYAGIFFVRVGLGGRGGLYVGINMLVTNY